MEANLIALVSYFWQMKMDYEFSTLISQTMKGKCGFGLWGIRLIYRELNSTAIAVTTILGVVDWSGRG